MKLLVVLLALGLRRTEPGRELTRLVAVPARRWRDLLLARGAREGWGGAVLLGLVVLPPVALALVLALALDDVFYRLPYSAFSLLLMLVLLLDRTLPDALTREREAWLAADEQAREVLAQADPDAVQAAAVAELARARTGLLAEQLRELFAPLFWFLLLGPVAALAYYLLRLAAEGRDAPVVELAQRLLHYAEWPVARVLALSFALAGDFVATWQHWRRHALETETGALALLEESALAAQPATVRMSAEALPGPLLVNALAATQALLQRALVIWIVLLALHTLWP